MIQQEFKTEEDFYRSLYIKNKLVIGLSRKKDYIRVHVKDQPGCFENIPSSILLDGELISVKITKSSFKLTNICSPDSIEPGLKNIGPTSKIFKNRSQLSILSGGCSINCWEPFDSQWGPTATRVTLGGIFRDKLDGSLVGLTVGHQLAKYPPVAFSGIDKNTSQPTQTLYYISTPFVPFFYVPVLGVEIFKEDDNFYGFSTNYKQTVENFNVTSINMFHAAIGGNIPRLDNSNTPTCLGWVKRATPLAPLTENISYINDTDVCIIGLSGRMIDKTSKNTIGMPSTIKPNVIQFWTQAEIDSWLSQESPPSVDFFFSGYTSGPQGKDTNTLCQYTLGGKLSFFNGTTYEVDAPFLDQMQYSFRDFYYFYRVLSAEPESNRTEEDIVKEGDSGTIVWMNMGGGQFKILGMIVGVIRSDIYITPPIILANGDPWETEHGAVFMPIWTISERFKIEPWNDDNLNFNKIRPLGAITDDDVPFTVVLTDPVKLTVEQQILLNININNQPAFYTGSVTGTERTAISYNY